MEKLTVNSKREASESEAAKILRILAKPLASGAQVP